MTTETTTAPAPEPSGAKRLTRSSSDRVIAGVCGGIGRYFGIDPVICRVIVIVLVFFGGAGILGYGAAWLLVPRDDAPPEKSDGRRLARRALVAFAVAVAVVCLFFGAAWATAVGSAKVVAIVVVIVGIALVAGGLMGGMRWLIAPALAIALGAGFVTAAGVDAKGGTGEKIYRPVSAADLRPSYRLGVGHLVLDLRQTRLTPGDHRVKLDLGIGGVEVFVPSDVCVSSFAHFGVGGGEVFDRHSGGVDVDFDDAHTAPAGTARLIVDTDIGIGGLHIERGPRVQTTGNQACTNG
jgi:phage shock protein PspC (stress-responsive transcriptional regulator)